MKQRIALTAVLFAIVALGAARAEEPATGVRWTLELEHGPLKIVSVRETADRTVTYHYMTLKVTNPTSLPRDWYPLVKALTDTNRTYVGMGFDEALPAIRAQEDNQGLVSIAETKGKIQPGQTIDGVAVFGPLDPLYDRVSVQVYGLADPIAIYKVETYPTEIELPSVPYSRMTADGTEAITTGVTIQDVAYLLRNRAVMDAMRKVGGDGELPDATVEYWEVSERRVYEMIYTRLGDEFRPDDDLISFERERWVVLGDVKALRTIEM